MHLFGGLPSALFTLLLYALPTRSEERAWKIHTEEEATISDHNAEIIQKLATRNPTSLRKMRSHDPGQVFYFSDWQFNDEQQSNLTTAFLGLPVLPHQSSKPFLRNLPPFLVPRAGSGFSCPANTNSCASIGAGYGCCPQGTTCQIGSNGDLGCCPGSSANCAGSTPTECEQGYTSCPLFHGGGGCCASGFQCQSEGCVGVSTTVVVIYPTVTITQTSTSSTISSTSTSTSTTTSTVIAMTTSTTSTSSTSSTSTSFSSSTSVSSLTTTTTTVSTSSSSLSSTPTSTSPISIPPLVPIAPTSLSTTTSTTSQPTTLFLGPCPTGFYACSAYFNIGSCCQIGRDCGRTSCPALTTSTALVSNGVTIADVSATGACATGWSTCGSDVGGGCCPTGYSCGTALCSATGVTSGTATAGSVISKEGSSGTASLRLGSLETLVIGLLCILAIVP